MRTIIDRICEKLGYIKEERLAEIMEERDFYARGYGDQGKKASMYMRAWQNKSERAEELEEENKKLQFQLAEYKRKYADEVQKRIEFIKTVKGDIECMENVPGISPMMEDEDDE